jgi:integral membrane protein
VTTATVPPTATRPVAGRRLKRIGVGLFAIGLVTIIVTFLDYAFGDGDRPLWQNLLCVLAPIGFGLVILGLVQDGRAGARAAAIELDISVTRPPRPVEPVGPVERGFRLVALLETMSWLLLIVATVVKYAAGHPIGVQILGPAHGVLFIGYVGLALIVGWRRRWSLLTIAIVLVESVIPGGGLLVYRRHDLQRD